MPCMIRRKFTLSIDGELADRMKVQAISEKRDVSTITEELYRGYLERLARAERFKASRVTKRK